MLVIIRQTYGYQKSSDWLTAGRISQVMNYKHRHNVNADIRELKNRKMIVQDDQKIGPNSHLSEWVEVLENKHQSVRKQTPKTGVRKQTPGCLKTSTGVLENEHKKCLKTNTTKEKRKYTKEINTKERETTVEKPAKKPRAKKPEISFENLPQNICISDAEEWIKFRIDLKKSTGKGGRPTQRAFDAAMKTFSNAPSIGMSPCQAIEFAMSHDWIGINLQWIVNAGGGSSGSRQNGNKSGIDIWREKKRQELGLSNNTEGEVYENGE